ncbi:hypothetical protein JCM15831A_10840 [Asaia astilbis]
MLTFLFPRLRRLESENESLRAQLSGARLLLDDARGKLWESQTDPARTLALVASRDKEVASKDKEIDALKSEIRALKRQRDRAGRFAPCEK